MNGPYSAYPLGRTNWIVRDAEGERQRHEECQEGRPDRAEGERCDVGPEARRRTLDLGGVSEQGGHGLCDQEDRDCGERDEDDGAGGEGDSAKHGVRPAFSDEARAI